MPRGTAKPLAVIANMPAPPALNFSMSLRVSRILSSRSIFSPRFTHEWIAVDPDGAG
jgi:hypothetical protein